MVKKEEKERRKNLVRSKLKERERERYFATLEDDRDIIGKFYDKVGYQSEPSGSLKNDAKKTAIIWSEFKRELQPYIKNYHHFEKESLKKIEEMIKRDKGDRALGLNPAPIDIDSIRYDDQDYFNINAEKIGAKLELKYFGKTPSRFIAFGNRNIHRIIGESEMDNIWSLYHAVQRRRHFDNLKKTTATASIFGFILGIFFLSPNMTGNVVGNLSPSTSNYIGIGLLVLGLFGGIFLLSKKVNSKKITKVKKKVTQKKAKKKR